MVASWFGRSISVRAPRHKSGCAPLRYNGLRMPADPVLAWLLDGDPAVRWQALRDLRGSSPAVLRREQRRVAREGWGARLLALQDSDGRWANGVYSPKWTSTTYTMLLLRSFGLSPGHPQALRATAVLLDAGFWRDGGINFSPGSHNNSETCVSAMVLSLACWRPSSITSAFVPPAPNRRARRRRADGSSS